MLSGVKLETVGAVSRLMLHKTLMNYVASAPFFFAVPFSCCDGGLDSLGWHRRSGERATFEPRRRGEGMAGKRQEAAVCVV